MPRALHLPCCTPIAGVTQDALAVRLADDDDMQRVGAGRRDPARTDDGPFLGWLRQDDVALGAARRSLLPDGRFIGGMVAPKGFDEGILDGCDH